MPYKWGKLMLNLGNAIDAITNTSGRENSQIFRAVQQEGRDILTRAGIRWVPNEELASQWPEIAVRPRGSLNTEAQSSTWQSLARRQGTVETDSINGEIVRLAKHLETQAPINEQLLEIVQEMASKHELPGKYTPTELCRLVGLG
jgi:2-dehydropantoate 2-reductase